MTINLDDIERIAREATPGPWFVGEHINERLAISGLPQPDDNPLFVHNGKGNVSDEPDREDARHIATMNPAATLELVAELCAARIGDDERTRLQFRASLAEHQRNDARRQVAEAEAATDEYRVANMDMLAELTTLAERVAELETQLASSDMAVSDLIDDFDREELGDAIHDAIRRHRAREGLE